MLGIRHLSWILAGLLLSALPLPAKEAADSAAIARAKARLDGLTDLTRQEPAGPRAPSDFTIVVLPDTQKYTASLHDGRPEMFVAQTDWILSNRASRQIAYVALVGDISEHGSGAEQEWWHATNALYRLGDPARTGLPDGIPCGVAVGNHDMKGGGTALFNRYFGVEHFARHGYYGGHFGTNNDSHYDLFTAGGVDFLVLSLVMNAGQDRELMHWADQVLQSHSNRQAIVVTHSLLNETLWPTPPTWTKEGRAIFEVISQHPNCFLMLCGHKHGEARKRETVGTNGHSVDLILADYQDCPHGGDGYLRVMEFSPSRRQIRVKTFSPWTGQWSTNINSQFTLDWTPPATPATGE